MPEPLVTEPRQGRTLVERPRTTKAFWLALALVAATRVCLGVFRERIDLYRGPTRDSSWLNIERNVVREAERAPRVLLMGSSRMRYGMPEYELADAAGLPLEDVLNVAVQAGTALEARWLLRRNPWLLTRASLVVLDLNRQMLRQDAVKPRFYRLASLADRLLVDGCAERVDAALDWILRHRADHRTLGEWLRGLGGLTSESDFLAVYRDRGLWWHFEHGTPRDESLQPEQAGLLYMAGFVPSDAARAHARAWIAACSDAGARTVIVHTPTHSRYRRSFDRIPGATEANRAYREWLAELARQTTVLDFDTPQSCQLDDSDFLDYGHLTRRGARKLTERVVAELAARGLLPRPMAYGVGR